MFFLLFDALWRTRAALKEAKKSPGGDASSKTQSPHSLEAFQERRPNIWYTWVSFRGGRSPALAMPSVVNEDILLHAVLEDFPTFAQGLCQPRVWICVLPFQDLAAMPAVSSTLVSPQEGQISLKSAPLRGGFRGALYFLAACHRQNYQGDPGSSWSRSLLRLPARVYRDTAPHSARLLTGHSVRIRVSVHSQGYLADQVRGETSSQGSFRSERTACKQNPAMPISIVAAIAAG